VLRHRPGRPPREPPTSSRCGSEVGQITHDPGWVVNLRLLGWIDNDLSALSEYVALAHEAIGVPLPTNYPVFGPDAFETGTGVHAAAVIKAFKKGDHWLADRVWVAGTPLAYVDGDDLEVHEVAEVPTPGGIAVDPVADRVCASRPNFDQLALLSGTTFDQYVATGDRPSASRAERTAVTEPY